MFSALQTGSTRGLLSIVALVVVLLCGIGCRSRQPILIGLAAELTGSRADSGVDIRDGAQLAVDTINEQGGISGRPIQLIVRNEKGDPDVARQVGAELIEQGVVAVVGSMTSNQTAAMWDQMNRAQVVLLSPTSASDQFTGHKDYLFRVMSSNGYFGRSLADYIYHTRGVRRLTGVYDLSNRAFAEDLWHIIQTRFEQMGGDASQSFTYTSGEAELSSFMAEIKVSEPEAILFIASAVDTALMVQYGRQQGLQSLLFSSTWAQTNDLLTKGGRAVEGLELSAVYDPKNPRPSFQAYLRQFESRYGREPGYPGVFAYEAVLVLAHALDQTGGEAGGLPEALTAVKDLEGVQGKISIDQYGDVKRDVFVAVVHKGQFKIINTIPPFD